MVDTVGKKLNQARTQKGITLDQAARATKMRPERILDLEDDNYNHFPNLAYAKGFLLLYAKYLGIDVSEFAESFRSSGKVGVEDYEYLSHEPDSRSVPMRREVARSMIPLMAIALIVVVGAVIVFLVINFQRLPELDATPRDSATATDLPPGTGPVPQLRSPPPAPPEFMRSDAPGRDNAEPAAVDPTAPAPIPPPIEGRDEISAAGAPGDGGPSASAPPALEPGDRSWVANATRGSTAPAVHELSLQPLKKTWVRIQKDDANSPPVFEDWLYPDARPLTFRGIRFWVKTSEAESLEVTKNGAPVKYEGSEFTIE